MLRKWCNGRKLFRRRRPVSRQDSCVRIRAEVSERLRHIQLQAVSVQLWQPLLEGCTASPDLSSLLPLNRSKSFWIIFQRQVSAKQ